MKSKINESDITRIVKKVLNENNNFITGPGYSEMTELVDDVINRIKEHGTKYIIQLNKLNYSFPVERYKRSAPPKRGDIEPPKGVRISKSVFPDEL